MRSHPSKQCYVQVCTTEIYIRNYQDQRVLNIRPLLLRDSGLVLATKASITTLYSNQYANPPCFRRRLRHPGSRYTYVAPAARASRCACNTLLVQEAHDQKYHGALLTTAKQTVRPHRLVSCRQCSCCTMVARWFIARLWNHKEK